MFHHSTFVAEVDPVNSDCGRDDAYLTHFLNSVVNYLAQVENLQAAELEQGTVFVEFVQTVDC